MDPRRTPQWIGDTDLPDQPSYFRWYTRSSCFAAGLVLPEKSEPGPVPSHDRLGPHDGDRPKDICLNAIQGRKEQTVPTSKIRPTSNLTPQHSNLLTERQDVNLCRRSGNSMPEQTPNNRFQEIKHRRRIVARSIRRSSLNTRMRLLVGTVLFPCASGQ